MIQISSTESRARSRMSRFTRYAETGPEEEFRELSGQQWAQCRLQRLVIITVALWGGCSPAFIIRVFMMKKWPVLFDSGKDAFSPVDKQEIGPVIDPVLAAGELHLRE